MSDLSLLQRECGAISIAALGLIAGTCCLSSAGCNGTSRLANRQYLVNMPFHEAGHVLAQPFPQRFTSMAGTLGQLAMPLACAVAPLLKARDPFGASAGHSAPEGFHDWQSILAELGLIHGDQLIAKCFWAAGLLGMAAAISWGAQILWNDYRSLDSARARGGLV